MLAALAHCRCLQTGSARAKEDKKMRVNMKESALFSTLALITLGVASGCSPSMHGGRTVEAGYVPKTLVTYVADGDTAEVPSSSWCKIVTGRLSTRPPRDRKGFS